MTVDYLYDSNDNNIERVVKKPTGALVRRLCFRFDDAGDLDLGGADHLDVDSLVVENLKHLRGHPGDRRGRTGDETQGTGQSQGEGVTTPPGSLKL